MNRQEKNAFIERLRKDFAASESAFLVSYKGLSVPQLEALRKDLRSKGARLQVAKMRLVKRAVEGLDSSVITPILGEQLGLVFAPSESPAVAKALSKFAKDNKSLLLIGGCFQSKFLDQGALISLSKLPSREQLLAQLCGTLQAPIAGLARILDAILKQREQQQV